MNKEKHCYFCGQAFLPKNSKARFCCTRHRVAYFKRKRRRQRAEELRRRLGLPLPLTEAEGALRFSQILDRLSNPGGDPR